ncbi:MAG: glycosyltransferase family 2 protein [Candidatus Sericytochromatia bacterium]|jgi:glycosyltransferase involved in cell wall biosynthesis|nr:glycosyltransferase family 2 protein [Candidatus Sericytochromatia bacterium]
MSISVPHASSRRLSGISCVLPAYNEADLIEKVVRNAASYLETVTDDYEVVVVNDGSTDATGEILDRLSAENARIVPVHQANQGYGGALQAGFARAHKDYVFFMDSDNQFDIRELDKLIPRLSEVDVVLGYRENRQDHLGRKFNAFGWRCVVDLLFGLGVRDIDCAFKIFKREKLQMALPESKGAMINAEMLIKLKRRRTPWVEVPVTHFPRVAGKSTGANIKVILRAFRELFRLHGKLKNF